MYASLASNTLTPQSPRTCTRWECAWHQMFMFAAGTHSLPNCVPWGSNVDGGRRCPCVYLHLHHHHLSTHSLSLPPSLDKTKHPCASAAAGTTIAVFEACMRWALMGILQPSLSSPPIYNLLQQRTCNCKKENYAPLLRQISLRSFRIAGGSNPFSGCLGWTESCVIF